MPPDSQEIDTALLTKLSSDQTLLGYMPDNVWFGEAPSGSKRFVRITLIDENDQAIFGGRKFEDARYQVTARVFVKRSGTAADAQAAVAAMTALKNAAARIDALLEDATLTATGYTTFEVSREGRIRAEDPDETDPTIRWYFSGGTYRVKMTVT